MSNSNVFFVHTWRQKTAGFGQTGWAQATDCFQHEDEEECIVTNVDHDKVKTIRDLWQYVRSEEDEEKDDGFGVEDPNKKKQKQKEKKVEEKVRRGIQFWKCDGMHFCRKIFFYRQEIVVLYICAIFLCRFQESLNFQLLMKMSGEACTTKTINCAPVIHYEKSKNFNFYQNKNNDIGFSSIFWGKFHHTGIFSLSAHVFCFLF